MGPNKKGGARKVAMVITCGVQIGGIIFAIILYTKCG